MRPLDRLFGALPYPYDLLLPSAAWLALCAAALFGLARLMRRRGSSAFPRALRAGLWLAAADVALWLGVVGARALHEGASPPWLAALEAPLAAARSAADTMLWDAVGVGAAVQPRLMFRGYSSWDGWPSVLAASVLNEAALVALATTAAICCAAWLAPRR
jgi:hypothetical protein